MKADPASLKAHVWIEGLTPDEGLTAFANLPAGATATVRVTQPPLGGKRYAVQAHGLSVKGARDLTTAVFLHCERVAEGGSDG